MRTSLYLLALVCSLPNLLAGLALAVLQHAFVTRNPLRIIFDFLEGFVWGVPLAAAIMLVLVMAGFFSETRRYAALISIALNAAALALVFLRIGPPTDFGQLLVFVPVVLALIAFGWIVWREFRAGSVLAAP